MIFISDSSRPVLSFQGEFSGRFPRSDVLRTRSGILASLPMIWVTVVKKTGGTSKVTPKISHFFVTQILLGCLGMFHWRWWCSCVHVYRHTAYIHMVWLFVFWWSQLLFVIYDFLGQAISCMGTNCNCLFVGQFQLLKMELYTFSCRSSNPRNEGFATEHVDNLQGLPPKYS